MIGAETFRYFQATACQARSASRTIWAWVRLGQSADLGPHLIHHRCPSHRQCSFDGIGRTTQERPGCGRSPGRRPVGLNRSSTTGAGHDG